MSAAEPSPSEPGAFSVRTVLALVLTGVFAFCAFIVLSTYAPDLRGGADGGAHALSPSAAGYAGAVRLLRMIGMGTGVSRNRAALAGFPGLLVLTPGRPLTASDLGRHRGDRLIVLPKRQMDADSNHPGWAVAGPLAPTKMFDRFAVSQLGTITVSRRSGQAAPVALSSNLDGWSSGGMTTGPIADLQTVAGPNLVTMVTDQTGAAVLAGVRDSRTFVLADPDLLNTQGIADLDTARVAVLMLSNLRDADAPVMFDVTLNGIASAHRLLKLAFEPPFLGVTLCLAIAAALIGLQAWNRFGPVRAQERAVALGKTALVENGAGMIGLARREPKMAMRYVRLCRERAIRALGAGDLPEAAQDAFLDRWAERMGVQERISGLLKAADEVKTAAALTPLAQRTRRWRAEMTHEPD